MARVKGTARPPFTLRVPAAKVSEYSPDTLEDLPLDNEASRALDLAPANVSTIPVVGDDDGSDDEGRIEDARTLEDCPILETAYNHYKANIKKYREYCDFGEGYKLGFPKPTTVVSHLCPRSVPVYEAVIDLGLRFPLHPFILEVLEGYGLGIWQITPNSWTNIFGYIATCELMGYPLSFPLFAFMHKLSRVCATTNSWYILSTRRSFMMTFSKPSKWKNWHGKFLYVTFDDEALWKILTRRNSEPYLLGANPDLPPIHPDHEFVLEDRLFETDVFISQKKRLIVPRVWTPDWTFFRHENFLCATGLILSRDRGE